MAVMAGIALDALPLGFRFRPTDEELINHYLKRKINGRIDSCSAAVIPEVDVCKCEPWDLPEKSPISSHDSVWFFFTPKDRKYQNGQRANRATEAGYWKATGRDRRIKTSGRSIIGSKKTLVFHRGRAPKAVRTGWIMHEYRTTEPEFETGNQGSFVLFRLFKKIEEKISSPSTEEVVTDDLSPAQVFTQQESDIMEEHEMPAKLNFPESGFQRNHFDDNVFPTYPLKPEVACDDVNDSPDLIDYEKIFDEFLELDQKEPESFSLVESSGNDDFPRNILGEPPVCLHYNEEKMDAIIHSFFNNDSEGCISGVQLDQNFSSMQFENRIQSYGYDFDPEAALRQGREEQENCASNELLPVISQAFSWNNFKVAPQFHSHYHMNFTTPSHNNLILDVSSTGSSAYSANLMIDNMEGPTAEINSVDDTICSREIGNDFHASEQSLEMTEAQASIAADEKETFEDNGIQIRERNCQLPNSPDTFFQQGMANRRIRLQKKHVWGSILYATGTVTSGKDDSSIPNHPETLMECEKIVNTDHDALSVTSKAVPSSEAHLRLRAAVNHAAAREETAVSAPLPIKSRVASLTMSTVTWVFVLMVFFLMFAAGSWWCFKPLVAHY